MPQWIYGRPADFLPRGRIGLLIIGPVLYLMVGVSCQGNTESDLSQHPVAEAALSVIESRSDRAAVKNQDGIDHLIWGHWRKAAADFRRAIKANPDLAEPHFNLALALVQLGKDSEAMVHFRTARVIAPNDERIAGSEILNRYLN